MAEAFDAVGFLSKILAEHGPLHEDDIARRFQDSGVADPDDVLNETNCPASQLLDERWVWLPAVLAGRCSRTGSVQTRPLDPETTVLDDSRRPVHDAREAAELAKQLPVSGEGALDPDDPQLAAFLDEFIRDYETKCLDESIPAFDGHTPRQAADDPPDAPT